MVRWKSKSCPRCGGDIFVDRDLDNWYEQCLQCSYRTELKTLDGFQESISTGEKCSEKSDGTLE